MGVQLGKLVEGKEIEFEHLTGKTICIDAFNWIFQFLSIIRDRETGEPLKNSKGRITSHLSGIFYRTANLIKAGVKPVWVFDGKPPEFKKVVEERRQIREKALERLEEARKKGDIEEIRIAAQQTSFLTEEMIEDSRRVLELMGVCVIQAPSEADAQIAFMTKNKYADYSASQDWDVLLFGSPYLIRNLSITGRRKLPRKYEYVEIKPELIKLKEMLNSLGIDQEQLILVGMLVGTDFNPGIKGIGPKTALKLVKKEKTLDGVLKTVDWNSQFEEDPIPAQEIYNFFKEPPITKDFEIKWSQPDSEALKNIMIDEFEFSQERVEKVLKILEQGKTQQSSLGKWVRT